MKIKNKGVIIFSILKYIEILIAAAIMFVVAKKVGPQEMGLAVPFLLYITYANYLSLGVNQVLLKRYMELTKDQDRVNIVSINLQYILCICVVNVILAEILLEKYGFLAALISSCILIRGFFSSYYRVIDRIHILNKNNLINVFLLLSCVLFFVLTWNDYMIFWFLCLVLTLILYVNDERRFFLNKVFPMLIQRPNLELLKINLSEGVKLGLTGLISTIILTMDRLVINELPISLSQKGSYQLADLVSMALYMVITTIVFYFCPDWIHKLKTDIRFRNKFVQFTLYATLSVPFILAVFYVSGIIIELYVFPEYSNLALFMFLTSAIKLSTFLISLLSIIYISADKEFQYIKSTIPFLSIYVIAASILLYTEITRVDHIVFVLLGLVLLEFTRRFAYVFYNHKTLF